MSAKKLSLMLVPALVGALASVGAHAAPTISRVTPPSTSDAALTDGAAYVARFYPSQRFDLQTTVVPDAGKTISSVTFAVDGVAIKTVTADSTTLTTGTFSDNSSMVKADCFAARLAPPQSSFTCNTYTNAVSAYYRAYSSKKLGAHTITVTATQSDGTSSTKTSNFQIVKLANAAGNEARNVIIFLGDGMGAAHRTAARIVRRGLEQGQTRGLLNMDMPYAAMVRTSSLDAMVTDSAPGMQNYVTGNKAANNQEGVWPDDTKDAFDNPRFEYLSEYLVRVKGYSLGVVTTADVTDATPASMAVHTSNRGAGTGIADQFLDERTSNGLTVLLGGGRKWFLAKGTTGSGRTDTPSSTNTTDYALPADIVAGWKVPAGALDASRDLLSDYKTAGFTYASNKSELASAGTPDKLLGLFQLTHMNVALDKINGRRGNDSGAIVSAFPDQPMLDEMTTAAINVLSKNKKGFILMVEGASIDKQSHAMDGTRAVLETLEFDRAVGVGKTFADQSKNTLVVVTADHECSGFSIIGTYVDTPATACSGSTYCINNVAPYQDNKQDQFNGINNAIPGSYAIQADGYPLTMNIANRMLIGFGASADRYENWQPTATVASVGGENVKTSTTNVPGGFLITGQAQGTGNSAVHTASDVVLSAYGSGASTFGGFIDNTDVFFKILSAVRP